MLRRGLPALSAAKEAFDYCVARTNPGVGRTHNLMLDRGEGSYVFDLDGKKYLDFACGIGVTNLGHCHPKVIEAAKAQLDKAWHLQVCTGPHTALKSLLERLERIFPAPLNNFSFVTTGAEAVEAALKLSRAATGRQNTVVLQGSYHGRTVATAAMTSSKFSYARGLRPLMPGVTVISVPYTSQQVVPAETDVDALIDQALAQVEIQLHQTTHPSEVSMLIAEPTLGEGGYVPLPRRYYQGLRRLCTKHGILLCVDEVQTGFGRTGTMFNFEQLAATPEELPDVVVFAKGIANGMPIAGIVTRDEIAHKMIPGQMGGTYAANAIACASASAVIDVMTQEGILDNVRARSAQLRAALEASIAKEGLPVMEVRGRGLMVGLQLADSVAEGTSGKIVANAAGKGLIVLPTSRFETLRIIPPLNVTADQIDEGVAKLTAAMCEELPAATRRAAGATAFVDCCSGAKQCCAAQGPCRRIVAGSK